MVTEPLTLYRVSHILSDDGSGGVQPDHQYFRTCREAIRAIKKVSLDGRTYSLEQVQTTAGKTLAEAIIGVICDGDKLWMKVLIIAFYWDGKRKRS